MNIQRFVAWDKLPSLAPKPDESSSSTSRSGSDDENERVDFHEKHKNVVPKVDSYTPIIEVPATVKNVLIKLDVAQLERAKKEISKKLNRIVDNVNQTYENYKRVGDFDPALEREYLLTPTWQERNRRARLLEEVTDVLDESVYKVYELKMVLESLRTWHETLSKIEQQKEDIRIALPIDEMGENLFTLIDSITTNVQRLFRICSSYSEQKTKLRRKSVSRAALFKQWKEKVAEDPKEGEPLTSEEMLENEPVALSRNQEVINLIQELADFSLFNKGECVIIKYILTMVQNLTRAFSILVRQCRSLKVRCENLEALERKKPDPQITQLQRELRVALDKKAALDMQFQAIEEKCRILTTTNEILQKELRDTHEKVTVIKPTFPKTPSERAIAKPQVDVSKKKDEKPFLKPPSEQRTTRTAKSEEKPFLAEKQQLKSEDIVKEKMPVTSETESLQKYLEPQAQETRMKVFPKLPGKDISTKQETATIPSDKLQAKLSWKDQPLKPSGEITSDATTTEDMKPLDTEPAPEGPVEQPSGTAEKIKAASKLEERKKTQKVQAKRGKRSKERDLVSKRSLQGIPSSTIHETPSEEEASPSISRESPRIPSSSKLIEPPKELPAQPVAVQPLPEQPVAPLPEQLVAPLPEQAVAPLPEQSVAPLTEQPVAIQPLPEQPAAPLPEHLVGPLPGQPAAPLPEYLVGPLPGQPAAPLPEYLVGPLPGQPAAPLPEYLVGPLPGQPAAQLPEHLVGPLPGQPAAPLPGQPAAPLPGYLVGPLPGQPAAIQPLPEHLVGPLSEQPGAIQSLPEHPAAPLPEHPVAPLPQQAVVGQPLPEQQLTIPHPSIQGGEKTSQGKLSLKLVSQRIIEEIRQKKTVKFLEDVHVPKPLTAPETDEILEAEIPGTRPSQQPDLERAEDTAAVRLGAAETHVQEFPVGKQKETQAKKETKGFVRILPSVPQPKLPEGTGNIINNVGTKLQELARQKGGVLDVETLKEFFEELDITHQETVPGQLAGSRPRDRAIPKAPLVKRPPFTPVLAVKKEKPKLTALEEESTGEDVNFVLQEFQSAILGSLEDKMETFKTGPRIGWKRPLKFQPTDPQVKQFFRIVDRKLEESFSMMKKKFLSALQQQKLPESPQGKGELPDGVGKPLRTARLPSFDTSPRLSEGSSSSSTSLSGELEQPLEHTWHLKTHKQRSSEHEEEPDEMRGMEEKPQDQVKGKPKLQKVDISSDEEEEEKILVAHLPDAVDDEESLDQEWLKEMGFLPETQEKPLPERQQHTETKSEVQLKRELEKYKEEQAWYMQFQDRLIEEQERLQEERQRLEEEAQYLDYVRGMFEAQMHQWDQQQQQRDEQERLWQVQLAHWQELQQKQEAQEQYWVVHGKTQREHQALLQEEVDRLERLHKQYLQRQGEEAKEEWQWEQLKAMHKEQQHRWQAEEGEQIVKRWQWQQQLAEHEEKMEALQQEYLEQEQKQKQWLQEQQEQQKEQERLWEKRWLGQLKRWRRQLQQQRAQQRSLLTLLEKGHKLQERQQVRQVVKEEKLQQPAMVKMVQGTTLDQFPLHQKIVLLSRESRVSTTPELTPKPSREFEESSYDLDHSWFPDLFRKAEMFHAPAVTERRYWIDVRAQRKNLELLKEALKKSVLPLDDYIKAKGMIRQALQGNLERLALLFRKYIIFCHLQDVRRNLTAQLDIAKYAKDGAKMKDLYMMVDKLDAYSKMVLERWTLKQAAVEKKLQRCLGKMIAFFAQLRLTNKLPLSSPCPLLIKAEDSTRETIAMPHIGSVFLKSKAYQSPLITVKKPLDFPYAAAIREPSSEQLETLWKTDITELSVPVGPKTPVSLLWSEACGYPDIPRLLELDISTVRNKPLQDVQTRIQNIPRWKITGYDFMHL